MTHYVLDAYIWKFDQNPRLREYLMGGPPAGATKPAAGGGSEAVQGKPVSATA